PIAAGIVVGLVVGKVVGVAGFTWLATRLRVASLPPGSDWSGILGVSALAGIGFTVSLFVAGLAFADAALEDEAKVAILGASVLAAAIGSTLIIATGRRDGRAASESGPAASLPSRAPTD
ncbi:MAG TPA: Na+/H+ antiporter NhaA, partial [Acidimicrobiales bacterium]|nr:Na+/H+ antiporter NhaA [Acidimicrobiales bacterium]